jgi:hypothetical protein
MNLTITYQKVAIPYKIQELHMKNYKVQAFLIILLITIQ